jgi:hypothetical protein
MKQLIRFGCLAALIYLQSCGGKMIKNDAADSVQKPQAHVSHTKIPVPIATDNLVIKDTKDLTGYWVGLFEPDTSVNPLAAGDRDVWNYANKINISIDKIDGDQVKGHSVVAGNFRPFTGTVEKEGPVYQFYAQEPGDDKYDGIFKFSISTGDSVLNGTWKANGNVKIRQRKYGLTKKLFHYDPTWQLEERRFVDWEKKKKVTFKDDDGTEYTDTSYLMTSPDIEKYNASTDLLTKDDAANLKKADIFILRNSIFARHGYSFKKQPLRVYFDQQDWYVPISTDVRADLTPIEKKNLTLLLRYEKHAKEYYDVFGR